MISVDGFEPVEIEWSSALAGIVRCTPAEIPLVPATSRIVGDVHRAVATSSVTVVGCGGHDTTGGSAFELSVAPLPTDCPVWARLNDLADLGNLAWGQGVTTHPTGGTSTVVGLSATPAVIHRLGFDVVATPDGLKVVDAPYGVLHLGDVLVSVDDVPLLGSSGLATLTTALGSQGTHTCHAVRDGVDLFVRISTSSSGLPKSPE